MPLSRAGAVWASAARRVVLPSCTQKEGSLEGSPLLTGLAHDQTTASPTDELRCHRTASKCRCPSLGATLQWSCLTSAPDRHATSPKFYLMHQIVPWHLGGCAGSGSPLSPLHSLGIATSHQHHTSDDHLTQQGVPSRPVTVPPHSSGHSPAPPLHCLTGALSSPSNS